MTKEELYEEMKIDVYNARRQEEEEARLDYRLEDDYDYFCEYFSSEFDEAIAAINTLKILHIKYNHTLDAEDLI